MLKSETRRKIIAGNWRSIVKPLLVALVFWAILAATWNLALRFGSPHPPLNIHQQSRLDDLGQLKQYRSANAELKIDPNRIVFFGDSITHDWNLQESFPGANYLNRGIGGQTSADMLVRFRQDVIDLQPRAVVILAGINDIGAIDQREENAAEHKLADLESNDESMGELADLHHIRPIFISLLPVHEYMGGTWNPFFRESPARIRAANQWLQGYCAQHHYHYIDAYSAMLDEHQMLRRDLTKDGLHPNHAGYEVMAQVVARELHRE
jgi:lysophospholipase L1-like esterase